MGVVVGDGVMGESLPQPGNAARPSSHTEAFRRRDRMVMSFGRVVSVPGRCSSKTDTSGKAGICEQARAEAYTGRKGLRDCVGVKREPFGS